jgi:phosphate transport system substrate-binding protein
MASWMCDGIPKDGKPHPEQHTSGKHETYENFGNDCMICGLSKEAVTSSKTLPAKMIAAVGLGVMALGVAFALLPKPCPSGQEQVNGACKPKEILPDPGSPIPPPSPGSSPTTSLPPIDFYTTYIRLADVPDIPNMVVRYGGSTTLAPLRCDRRTETPVCRDPSNNLELLILQAYPGFQLIYTDPPAGEKPGSGSGIRMLLRDQISFSHSSRPLEEKDFKDFERTLSSINPQAIPIAIDGIAIYGNGEVVGAVPGLTLSQLKDIYTCKKTNWRDFGGPDLEIIPFSRDPNDGGTPEYFKDTILEGEEFGTCVSLEKGEGYTYDTTDSIRKVAKTSGGIGYASASEVCDQESANPLAVAERDGKEFVPACIGRQINKEVFIKNAYPISRRVFVVIQRDGTSDEKAGIAYVRMALSDEGQELIGKAGFVPIR